MRMFHHCGEPVAFRYNWDGLFTTYHTYPQGQPVPDFSAPAKVCPRCGCRFAPKNVSLRQWPVGTELLLYRTWDEGPGTRWVRVTVPAWAIHPDSTLWMVMPKEYFKNLPTDEYIVQDLTTGKLVRASARQLRLPSPMDIAKRHLGQPQEQIGTP